MSIMNLPKTILIILINLVPIVLLFLSYQATPVLIMFGLSVPAYVCSMLFVKIFKRYEPEEEETNPDELETLSFIREEEEEKRRLMEQEKAEKTGENAENSALSDTEQVEE